MVEFQCYKMVLLIRWAHHLGRILLNLTIQDIQESSCKWVGLYQGLTVLNFVYDFLQQLEIFSFR